MTETPPSLSANYNANIYRDVVENLKEVVFVVDRTGKFTLLNKAWAEITGFSVDSSIGKYFLDFVHPEERANNLDLFIPLMDKRKSVCRHVTRYLTESGGFRYMKIHARLVLDENDDANGCVGTMNDVTELKVYEDKLRDAAIVIDAAMDGIAHVNENGAFTHLNKAYLSMLGYDVESDLIGKSWKTHYSAEELAKIESDISPKLATNGYWSGVGRATRKDGTTFPMDISLTVLADGGMACICRDVTEKVNVANALRASETRWQLAVESIRDGILDADLTTGIIHLSAGWQTLLGLEPYELVTNWSKLNRRIHPEDRKDLLDAYDNTGDGKHFPDKGMHRMMAADGNYRWIHLRGRELFDDNGRPIRIVGTATDVSEQKKAEEQLLANLARERDLNEMKSHFVSMASHELRTPLATLTLGLDFLVTHRKRLSEEQIEKTLGTVREGNQQLISIFDDLLLLGRADEGQLRCSLEQVTLSELLNKILQDPSINEKHRLRIVISCETPSLLVDVDPQLIRHILLNLLSNACKYSGDDCSVYLNASVEDYSLKLSVKDSGIGIPEEDRGRVFSLFFRSHNVGMIPGTGLGLMVVKRCIEAHNGDISFESSTNKGTCFTVMLPHPNTASKHEI